MKVAVQVIAVNTVSYGPKVTRIPDEWSKVSIYREQLVAMAPVSPVRTVLWAL